MADGGDDTLSPDQLAARWGNRVKVKTLANWRCRGEGPAFQKIGSRIGYKLSDVLAYERRNRFQKTADYGKQDEGK